MLVSHRKRFIYLKTAKTAGTSVEMYFEHYCLPESGGKLSENREAYESEFGIIGRRGSPITGVKWGSHMSAERVKRQLEDELWDSYFKFCVIRNPFDRLVSAYHFLFRDRLRKSSFEEVKSGFRQWLLADDHKARDLAKYLRAKYIVDDEICVDYFIRYETLYEGVEHVCESLGVPYLPERMPRRKTGIRPGGREVGDYFDSHTKKMVTDWYELELELFKYPIP